MNETPEFPQTPEGMKAWLESLGSADLKALTDSMAGDLRAAASGVEGFGAASAERASNETQLPEPPDEASLLTVHLSLDDTDPQVWRRLTVRGELSLDEVHHVVQAAMGWTDSHLHQFYLGDAWSGAHFLTAFDLDEGEVGTTETEARLDQVLRTPGDELGYTYDFGDGWNHTLRLEAVADPASTAEVSDPGSPTICSDGAGACPPEDVGGIPGYDELAAWVRHGYDRAHAPQGRDAADLAELRNWVPAGWHPDEFSTEETNGDLARVTKGAAGGGSVAIAQLPAELQAFVGGVSKPSRFDVEAWLAHPDWSEPAEIDVDTARALTRPLRVVLEIVGDGVALTAAGYLPPRTVEQIFTTLDLNDEWIGKGNREDLTPPVADLREAVRTMGLIRKVKGRLVPTAVGRKLADDPERLLTHVARRLPLEKDGFGRLASLVLLLAVGGGRAFGDGDWRRPERQQRTDLLDAVCRPLADAGWRTDTRPLESLDVMRATRPTCDLLDIMLRDDASRAVSATLARLILVSAG